MRLSDYLFLWAFITLGMRVGKMCVICVRMYDVMTHTSFHSFQFDSIVDALSEKSQVDSKYYSNMCVLHPYPCTEGLSSSVRFHGWAAARANLSDPDNKREYEDLYSRAAAFFRKALAQA